MNTSLKELVTKEEMGRNSMPKEILTKFSQIKEAFLRTIILEFNLEKDEIQFPEFIKLVLNSNSFDMKMKLFVMNPSGSYKKLNFTLFLEGLRGNVHA